MSNILGLARDPHRGKSDRWAAVARLPVVASRESAAFFAASNGGAPTRRRYSGRFIKSETGFESAMEVFAERAYAPGNCLRKTNPISG
jgi:hypothetical protein